jgi:DNA topoisomerase-1
MKNVVIVESPAKAKTINRYLGKDFIVLASYGHIRDLPSKNGSVSPDDNFSMIWEIDERAKKVINEISKAVKDADVVYLATDPDREGEAISWHISEILKEKKALKKQPLYRIAFNEITQRAVNEAINNPRAIEIPLVDAYLARRALDYLYGFTLSPVLWRKLPGAKSAGRVQSVALRLIVDREKEIDQFVTQEYWSILGTFKSPLKEFFDATLTHYKNEKLQKFTLTNEKDTKAIVSDIQNDLFIVDSIQKKDVKRSPSPPFITSTLQQEAARKLGFPALLTMRVAQKLYEGIDIKGESVALITYMRTDSVNISKDALTELRSAIHSLYGEKYCPQEPRFYKNKVKNAQEAHEAIRPIAFDRSPQELKPYLDDAQFKLYDLIWKRTIASQMENALLNQVSIDLKSPKSTFRATGSIIAFDGFLKVYKEGVDEGDDEDADGILPLMKEGDSISLEKLLPRQHFTQPPPRYSEASLVKKLEELGIGRPSTYASILNVLQERNYVIMDKKQFVPEDRGKLVISFLTHFFLKYVEYDFTAQLEDHLDDISEGKVAWQKIMKEFWDPFSLNAQQSKDLKPEDINKALEVDLNLLDKKKECPTCQMGQLELKLSRYGAFLGCNRYPDCSHREMISGDAVERVEDTIIGTDPTDDVAIILKKGPYGFYLQWGENSTDKKKKAKRVSIPASIDPKNISLSFALKLKTLPWTLGEHPESGDPIVLGIGPFGPYAKHQDIYASIPKSVDFWDVNLEGALSFIAQKLEKIATKGPSKRSFKKASPTAKSAESAPKKVIAKKTSTKKSPVKKISKTKKEAE